jgi:outer membrane protein assembly factor BamE (lipoprotein component of BamABCDE complex)
MKRLAYLFILAMVLGGCESNVSSVKNKLAQLKPNMTTEQVRQIMGEPFSTEHFSLGNEHKSKLVWKYKFVSPPDNSGIEHPKLSVLIFQDNLLIDWGGSSSEKSTVPMPKNQDIK